MRKRMTVFGGVLGAGFLMATVLRAGGPVAEPKAATAPAPAPLGAAVPGSGASSTVAPTALRAPAVEPAPVPLRARVGAAEPGLVSVPAALRARVPQLEMSGLAWAPALDRYLVVVDDTIDNDDGSRHAPFVLALDRAGNLDAAPVPIVGVDEVDDAEALAAGPDNTFFLLTSHSPNRHGKVHKPRRQLLELKLDHRQLRVSGVVDLLHGKGDIVEQVQKLGLPADTTVDLEGLAYHDGALYVGMKSPLLLDGSAAIFRLDRQSEAFARGKVPKQSLSIWAQIKLEVPSTSGAAVNEGVADLFFAADGALYLCANSPKGYAKDGGGALWRIAAPRGGVMEAKLVRRFVQLKPEGITAAPQGGALTVVFDRDRRDPLWMTWPIGK